MCLGSLNSEFQGDWTWSSHRGLCRWRCPVTLSPLPQHECSEDGGALVPIHVIWTCPSVSGWKRSSWAANTKLLGQNRASEGWYCGWKRCPAYTQHHPLWPWAVYLFLPIRQLLCRSRSGTEGVRSVTWAANLNSQQNNNLFCGGTRCVLFSCQYPEFPSICQLFPISCSGAYALCISWQISTCVSPHSGCFFHNFVVQELWESL